MNLVLCFCGNSTKRHSMRRIRYRAAICRDLSAACDCLRWCDQVLFHRRRDGRHDVAGEAGLLSLVSKVAHGGGHPKDIGVAWLGGIAAGEVRDTPQSVAHGVWMNEQLASAGFDRAAAVEVGVEGL